MSAAGLPCLWGSHRFWSLWDMLQSYLPIYELALDLQKIRRSAELVAGSGVPDWTQDEFLAHLEKIQQVCADYDFSHTSRLAQKAMSRPLKTHDDIAHTLNYLSDSLVNELEKEAVFRIPPERQGYFECTELFGPEVAVAFPSCARDIRQAGNCYALGQEDACVHHLMLVLERGLYALANKVDVPPERANWQNVINEIGKKLKPMPRGPEREFYEEVNSQFGFLKVAYRNHSEHAREDRYDMPKALSILNHVREFMKQLAVRCEEELQA